MLKTGQRAPVFSLPTIDRQEVALRHILDRGHNVLLVFLGHLG